MKRHILTVALITMMTLISAAAFAAGGGDHGGDIGQTFWTSWGVNMINFIVFAAVIWKYGVPKIQEYFSSRRDNLMADLEEARSLRAQAQEKLDEYSARLDNLEKERQAIMDDYHAQGQRENKRIIDNTNKQIEKMRRDAEALIAAETRRAIASIERQAVDLAVNLATERVQSKLNDGTQNALVDRYVNDLKEMV